MSNFAFYKIRVKEVKKPYKSISYLSYSQFLKRSLLMPGKQLHLKYNGHL